MHKFVYDNTTCSYSKTRQNRVGLNSKKGIDINFTCPISVQKRIIFIHKHAKLVLKSKCITVRECQYKQNKITTPAVIMRYKNPEQKPTKEKKTKFMIAKVLKVPRVTT